MKCPRCKQAGRYQLGLAGVVPIRVCACGHKQLVRTRANGADAREEVRAARFGKRPVQRGDAETLRKAWA